MLLNVCRKNQKGQHQLCCYEVDNVLDMYYKIQNHLIWIGEHKCSSVNCNWNVLDFLVVSSVLKQVLELGRGEIRS